ncbi:heterokaryon incompatibility protein-domain-containing protein [Halenospora varia]|nr:heterokaryon incompatibility protein-domain-containing protein [Halenospora varia]
MSTHSEHMYKPLKSPRTIRLLKFLRGTDGSPEMKLIYFDIEKAPPYMALSYTWGSGALEDQVSVDGSLMPITANLGDAIRSIHGYLQKNGLMLWADLICINQADLHERSQQVRLMSLIYRCAETVGIWLGKAEDDSDLAIEQMRVWQEELEPLIQNYDGDFELAIASTVPANSKLYGTPGSIETRAWEGFSALLQRPWWTRAWIVQEATTGGAKKALLFCGQQKFDWITLRIALKLSHHALHHKILHCQFENPHRAFILEDLRGNREVGAYTSLFDVLEVLRSLECRDPRDSVYAALGIATDISDSDIIPDYTKSVKDVYLEVVKFYLSKPPPHSLDFLGFVIPPTEVFDSDRQNLPSWVPNWHTYGCYAFGKSIDSRNPKSREVYMACGNLAAHPRITDNQLLHVEGYQIDTIDEVCTACYLNLARGGVNVERSWVPKDGDCPYPLGGTNLEAFNHAICADTKRKDVSDSMVERAGSIDWEIVDRDTSLLTPAELKQRMCMLIDLKYLTVGRRLFKTSKGLIGLGAAGVEKGDIICLFSGGQLLYVLRETSKPGQYSFMGECYVHGLMDGEAVPTSSELYREFILT